MLMIMVSVFSMLIGIAICFIYNYIELRGLKRIQINHFSNEHPKNYYEIQQHANHNENEQSDDHSISDDQLNDTATSQESILNIASSNHAVLLDMSKISIKNAGYHIEPTNPNPELYLLKTNTFLHRMFTQVVANKIINSIFGKVMLIFMSTMVFGFMIVLAIFWWIDRQINTLPFRLYEWILGISMNTYFCVVLLSLNVRAAKEVCKSFEFWFKTVNWIIFWSCEATYFFYVSDEYKITLLSTLEYHLFYLAATLWILCYFLVDAMNKEKGKKIKFGIMIIGIICIAMTMIKWTFLLEPIPTFHIFGNLDLDIKAIGGSAIRIVCLFAAKQTIKSLAIPDTATMIKKSVKIVYHD